MPHLATVAKSLCLVFLLQCTGAMAQVPAPLLGTWAASWQTDNRTYDSTMTITETGGTWQTAVRYRNNACAGREVPMRLDASSPSGAEFTLMFSEVLTGCTNAKVALNVGQDGKVTGTRSKFELTLVKK